MTGRYWSMRGEYTPLPYCIHVFVCCRSESASTQLIFQQRNGKERCVALVHVVDGGFVADRIEDAYPTHTKKCLLAQAIVAISSIELICQNAIARVVLFKV